MQTVIRCPQDALWDVLTKEDAFQHYDFLQKTERRTGDTVTCMMPDDTVILQARDLKVVPKTRLVIRCELTWAADKPPSRITFANAV